MDNTQHTFNSRKFPQLFINNSQNRRKNKQVDNKNRVSREFGGNFNFQLGYKEGFAVVGTGGLCEVQQQECKGRKVQDKRRKIVGDLSWTNFASLSTSLQNRLQDRFISDTFASIDLEGRGEINAQDLELYATKNGLPSTYAQAFLKGAVNLHSNHDKKINQINNKDKKNNGVDGQVEVDLGTIKVSFKAFQTYVKSRETGLRRAFQLFDTDGDGKISSSDLEYSLQHIIIKCPYSRCTYKCRKCIVERFIRSLDDDKNQTVEFKEFRKFFLLLPQNDMLVDYWMSSQCGGCDIGGAVMKHDKKVKGSPWGHLFAGAMAGAASRTATAPLETLRLRAMTGAVASGTPMVEAAEQLIKERGWKALYAGNLANVVRSAPQKALDFFAFDGFKRLLGGTNDKPLGSIATFTAAGLAGATSNVILYPLEVIRCRLSVDCNCLTGGIGGVFKVGSDIVKKEGVGALYRGLGPSVAAIIPEAAITYGMFDILKRGYSRMKGTEDVSVVSSLCIGVTSAFTGQLVAFPLEVVSRHLQVNSGQTFGSAFNSILQQGGPTAFYRGIGAATMRVLPMACISFGTYEMVRYWITKMEETMDELQAKKQAQNQCEFEFQT